MGDIALVIFVASVLSALARRCGQLVGNTGPVERQAIPWDTCPSVMQSSLACLCHARGPADTII
jgi:hypothetical protein